MPIGGVVFDLGGTLMTFDGEWEAVYAQNAANLLTFLHGEGLEMEAESLSRTLHRRRDRAYSVARATRVEYPIQRTLGETLAELGHPDLGGHLLAEGVAVYYQHEEALWALFPDAVPTLEALQRAGYRLGLISNASDDALIGRLVRRLGLEPYLDPALNSAGVGIRKPDPRLFQMVLDEWGLEPGEAVMVGDTLAADILGAQLAGMRGILALMDENSDNGELRDRVIPDATIDSLCQLPPLLATWDRGRA